MTPRLAAADPWDGLLINELHLDASSSFVELLNAGVEDAPLEGLFLANTGSYYAVPAGAPADVSGGFVLRLPAGPPLRPGEYFVIALDPDYRTAFARPADAAIDDFGDDLPVLQPPYPEARASGTWATSRGMLTLFWWDGASDLVLDVDMVRWGSGGPAVDRSGLAQDGPDDDATATAYAEDTAVRQQWQLGPPRGLTFARVGQEGGERAGGNGISGFDETSEPWPRTFARTRAPTPGRPNLRAWRLSGVVASPAGPAADAEVRIAALGLMVHSDLTGAFDFGLVPRGSHHVAAVHPHAGMASTTAEVGDDDADILLELSPPGALRGRIEVPGVSSPALAGTVVELATMAGAAAPEDAVTVTHTTNADADGDYQITGIAGGRYGVRFRRPGFVTRHEEVVFDGDGGLQGAHTTSDGRLDTSLQADTHHGVRVYLVGSVVRLPAGTRVELAPVGSSAVDGRGRYAVLTEHDGAASVAFKDVQTGTYRLSVDAEGHEPLELAPMVVDRRLEIVVQPVPRALTGRWATGCAQTTRAPPPPTPWALLALVALLITRRRP